ncbi:hypothetical protein SLOPH_912 [Spraguea lophii 42_110]|uniref:Uncharacterized protein n=1 Tax=Spraguea lophii (strain 42_110) TaxID=1358809 RepID=S7WB59_SPRLO|nr:hypothetical protein SLOPH_912 [Spraguea lophii 42_110]
MPPSTIELQNILNKRLRRRKPLTLNKKILRFFRILRKKIYIKYKILLIPLLLIAGLYFTYEANKRTPGIKIFMMVYNIVAGIIFIVTHIMVNLIIRRKAIQNNTKVNVGQEEGISVVNVEIENNGNNVIDNNTVEGNDQIENNGDNTEGNTIENNTQENNGNNITENNVINNNTIENNVIDNNGDNTVECNTDNNAINNNTTDNNNTTETNNTTEPRRRVAIIPAKLKINALTLTKAGIVSILDIIIFYFLYRAYDYNSMATILLTISLIIFFMTPLAANELFYSFLMIFCAFYMSLVNLEYETRGNGAIIFRRKNIDLLSCMSTVGSLIISDHVFIVFILTILCLFRKLAIISLNGGFAILSKKNNIINIAFWIICTSIGYVILHYEEVNNLLKSIIWKMKGSTTIDNSFLNLNNLTDKNIFISLVLILLGSILLSIGYVMVVNYKRNFANNGFLMMFFIYVVLFQSINNSMYKYPIEEGIDNYWFVIYYCIAAIYFFCIYNRFYVLVKVLGRHIRFIRLL